MTWFRTIGKVFPTLGKVVISLKRIRSCPGTSFQLNQERRSTTNTITNSVDPGHDAVPTAQALLTMKVESENAGSTCALLTPAIKARLKELESGQVLEIRVNDSTARGDVAAWCRLSGNDLLAMRDEGDQGLRFFVRKK
jgi:tRNA 2-thiouridine synthesizing protein A